MNYEWVWIEVYGIFVIVLGEFFVFLFFCFVLFCFVLFGSLYFLFCYWNYEMTDKTVLVVDVKMDKRYGNGNVL